jgi:hypothetical protein
MTFGIIKQIVHLTEGNIFFFFLHVSLGKSLSTSVYFCVDNAFFGMKIFNITHNYANYMHLYVYNDTKLFSNRFKMIFWKIIVFMLPPWNGRGHIVLPFVIPSFHQLVSVHYLLNTFNSNLVYGYIIGLCRSSSNLVIVKRLWQSYPFWEKNQFPLSNFCLNLCTCIRFKLHA